MDLRPPSKYNKRPKEQSELLEGKVSVVFPTFNEKDNIGPLIEEVLRYTPAETEVVVVDDDSPDGTWKVVEDMQKVNPHLRLLHRTTERGLTSALRAGIAAARGDVVVWSDCDFSMPPAKVEDLLAEIGRGADVAVGSRFVEGGGVRIVHGSGDTLMAYLMSRILNRFIRRVLGRDFHDYTSGFIAVRKAVLDRIPLRGGYGEYFIDLVYRAKKLGFRLVESPYLCVERRSGVGKTGQNFHDFIRKGWKYVWLTIKLRFTKIR
jgi:dolichol-phosphate mannosyltransferase